MSSRRDIPLDVLFDLLRVKIAESMFNGSIVAYVETAQANHIERNDEHRLVGRNVVGTTVTIEFNGGAKNPR